MVPYDVRGLFKKLFIDIAANANSEKDAVGRLDAFVEFLIGGELTPYLWIGNEPSFGIPFMDNWTSKPHKTQALARCIMGTFTTKQDGLPIAVRSYIHAPWQRRFRISCMKKA